MTKHVGNRKKLKKTIHSSNHAEALSLQIITETMSEFHCSPSGNSYLFAFFCSQHQQPTWLCTLFVPFSCAYLIYKLWHPHTSLYPWPTTFYKQIQFTVLHIFQFFFLFRKDEVSLMNLTIYRIKQYKIIYVTGIDLILKKNKLWN